MVSNDLKEHLDSCLIPFWKKLRDIEFGGYYGLVDSRLRVDRKAVKGCILNSRILWFFSNAAMCRDVFYADVPADAECKAEEASGRGTDDLKEYADWAYRFLQEKCLDREKGGVYWSVDYTGAPEDTTKHTYNQAFAVYALSSYFRAYHDREALALADELVRVIEEKCFDEYGYKEALDREFHPIANDKLSENGVMADRTMNTLLHILEAYTEYLLACKEAMGQGSAAGHSEEIRPPVYGNDGTADTESMKVKLSYTDLCSIAGTACDMHAEESMHIGIRERLVRKKLHWIFDLIENRVYNPKLHRQEVFFNRNMESLIDLHSYGHDIEAAWLMDRCLDVLGEEPLSERISPILRSLEEEVYKSAYSHHSLANECERGIVDTRRIWWVQAEGVVGFYNAWQRTGKLCYREASEDIWKFIREHLVDGREGGEWFWYTDQNGSPAMDKPIVEPWKCPYHNGRMCMEIISRTADEPIV